MNLYDNPYVYMFMRNNCVLCMTLKVMHRRRFNDFLTKVLNVTLKVMFR